MDFKLQLSESESGSGSMGESQFSSLEDLSLGTIDIDRGVMAPIVKKKRKNEDLGVYLNIPVSISW